MHHAARRPWDGGQPTDAVIVHKAPWKVTLESICGGEREPSIATQIASCNAGDHWGTFVSCRDPHPPPPPARSRQWSQLSKCQKVAMKIFSAREFVVAGKDRRR